MRSGIHTNHATQLPQTNHLATLSRIAALATCSRQQSCLRMTAARATSAGRCRDSRCRHRPKSRSLDTSATQLQKPSNLPYHCAARCGILTARSSCGIPTSHESTSRHRLALPAVGGEANPASRSRAHGNRLIAPRKGHSRACWRCGRLSENALFGPAQSRRDSQRQVPSLADRLRRRAQSARGTQSGPYAMRCGMSARTVRSGCTILGRKLVRGETPSSLRQSSSARR